MGLFLIIITFIMKEIVEQFKGLARVSNRIIKLIPAYEKLKENAIDNAYLMEKKLVEISKIVSGLPDFSMKNVLIDWLTQERQEIEKAKEEFRFEFGEKLRILFHKDNKTIRGQYPILRTGFYTIVLNFEFGEAGLFFGPEIEKVRTKIPLEPLEIYQAVKEIDGELKETKFDPKEFYLDLQNAYKRRLALSNKEYGEKVLIMDVLNEYVMLKQPAQFFTDPRKENYREFSRIKLAYLFYLFKNSEYPDTNIHLYTATLDATADRKLAIWIPDNEEGEGTYFSYLAFENRVDQ